MQLIKDLNFGFHDGSAFLARKNKELLKDIFVEIEDVARICEEHIYYLIGEKGTGKTTYAAYLSNSTYHQTIGTKTFSIKSSITSISETEYDKFITLKKENHLHLSGYQSIWKVVLLLIIAGKIIENEGQGIFSFAKFLKLKHIIDEFYKKAFSPEISTAISFVEKSKASIGITAKYLKGDVSHSASESSSHDSFQTDLLYLEKTFKDCIQSLKLNNHLILFIDGIDVRPESISYDDYLECIKGLAHAMWSLNSNFFGNIKDSKGRLKVVLLLRPDIFNSLNLQNASSKLNDNAVIFNWEATYENYQRSQLFHLAEKLLSHNQKRKPTNIWDVYFPYTVKRQDTPNSGEDSSFIPFLRNSFYRPRDIVAQLSYLQQCAIRRDKEAQYFVESDSSHDFMRLYSEYALGQVKDYLKFYFSDAEYESFISFFPHLKGLAKFTYSDFAKAYELYAKENNNLPKPLATEHDFLQFLYDLNVIGYYEYVEGRDAPFIRWGFREKTFAHMSPKVMLDSTYIIHNGLLKALNLGRRNISYSNRH